ncbi:MAG: radical SAM protein [Endomicrobia bacterium]|nr:radical SAM protein [Endomicrobiia bacterium]
MLKKIKRFIITNETAYKISVILRIKQIKNFFEKTLKFNKKIAASDYFIEDIHYHIIDRCNLNCKNCSSFSPIAKDNVTDINTFTKDLKRLAELTGGKIKRLNLTGGEPLLHPDLLKMLSKARNIFPNIQIRIGTNGILLPNQTDEFWETLQREKISLIITRYPIKLNWKTINKKSDDYKIDIDYQGLEIGKKTSHHFPLDTEGGQDGKYNYENGKCNGCYYLKNGKFSICSIPVTVNIFNEYFNKNIPVMESSFIDIYKASDIKEILDYISKPIDACRYCAVKKRTYNSLWGVSKKEISEWI